MDARMKHPKLLSAGDAINLLAVLQELHDEKSTDEAAVQSAAGLADLLARNAAAVRYATQAVPRTPPDARELLERAQGRQGDLQRAMHFLAEARLHLYGDEETDFATLEIVDFLLAASSVILLTTEADLETDGETESLAAAPADAAPEMAGTLRFPRLALAATPTVH